MIDWGDMLKKTQKMIFLYIVFILCALSIVTSSCKLFPSERYINKTLKQYEAETNPQEREKLIFDLLEKTKYGDQGDHIMKIEMTLDRMSELYRKNNDVSMLSAVDRTEITTGYANCICVFYASIKDEKGFKERYSKPENREYLGRCVGISFDKDELDNILKDEMPK